MQTPPGGVPLTLQPQPIQQQPQPFPQQPQAQSQSESPEAAQFRQQFQQAMSRARALSSEIDLACPSAAVCGLAASANASMAELMFAHPDLSVAASHAVFLPFLQPFFHSLQSSGRSFTGFVPAATAAVRAQTYEAERFCGRDSPIRDSDACRSLVALNEVDTALVRNAKELAAHGQQTVRPAETAEGTGGRGSGAAGDKGPRKVTELP